MSLLLSLCGVFVTGVLGAVAAYRAPDRRLARLDLETLILSRLPAESRAAADVRAVVTEHAHNLREDLHVRRDWRAAGFLIAVYFVFALGGLVAIDNSERWWIDLLGFVAVGIAIAALVGAIRSSERRPRNRDGSPRT